MRYAVPLVRVQVHSMSMKHTHIGYSVIPAYIFLSSLPTLSEGLQGLRGKFFLQQSCGIEARTLQIASRMMVKQKVTTAALFLLLTVFNGVKCHRILNHDVDQHRIESPYTLGCSDSHVLEYVHPCPQRLAQLNKFSWAGTSSSTCSGWRALRARSAHGELM